MTEDLPVDELDIRVGATIREIRLERGLSMTAAAEHLGVSYQQQAKYEKGENRITAGKLYQLSELLGVPIGVFFRQCGPLVEVFDSRIETFGHISRVQELLGGCIVELMRRAHAHDRSKLDEPERPVFDREIPRLQDAPYGTDAYRDGLLSLGPALEHHYACNRHHPEHFAQGVAGMTLLDLLEMVVDWKAASERGGDPETPLNLSASFERFGIDGQLRSVLVATAAHFGWVHA